jgi:asparagine synthase (glutamine-hydrolysing)
VCAIVGLCGQNIEAARLWLSAARDVMRHRGPDDGGEWWSEDGNAALGHRRLVVIDLTAAGSQPMQDLAQELCIVFNGEIYNFQSLRRELSRKGHQFRSQCDTEVILAAYREWGYECLSHLNGMFAFALYDARRGELFLARDRAGEKPLFYAVRDGTLRFASELKALFTDPSLPRRIDLEALDCYLGMGFVPGDRCIVEGVKKLPPGHAMVFRGRTGEAKLWRYWRLPEFEGEAGAEAVDEEPLIDELERLLGEAVRRQLVADVPVGILLSGGVDSSLVTAFAARAAPHVKSFTIRFPGHGKYDETEHARLIARHFGTEHRELAAMNCTIDLLPQLAHQFDEPIVDSSMIPTYLVTRLVREHCKVALGGDGGDELFGGYGHYDRLLWMQKGLSSVPQIVRSGIARSAAAVLPVGLRGRNWLQLMDVDLEDGLPLIATAYFDRRTRERLLGESHRGKGATAEHMWAQRVPCDRDLLQRATRMDFENYLPEDILVKVDRASMLNSLEMRSPLLDYRVIEFAFRKVPSSLKATPMRRKVLLKKLAGRLLPREFDIQRKQGFAAPIGSWLQGMPWGGFFRDVLLAPEATFFDHQVVSQLLQSHGRQVDNSERLFALVMFELWRREYRMSA